MYMYIEWDKIKLNLRRQGQRQIAYTWVRKEKIRSVMDGTEASSCEQARTEKNQDYTSSDRGKLVLCGLE